MALEVGRCEIIFSYELEKTNGMKKSAKMLPLAALEIFGRAFR
jgi:hypothetical protein